MLKKSDNAQLFFTVVAVRMSQSPHKAKPSKQAAHNSLLGNSALIRKVQTLLDKEIPNSQTRFSERLTQNMDFSSSLKLSELHGHLRILDKKSASKSTESHDVKAQLKIKSDALNAAFDRVQRAILQMIDQSFDAEFEQPRYPLPKLNVENGKPDLSVYQAFYSAQQKEMSAKIQGLRTYIRETLSASSVNMAKLALLDLTLEETIGFPLRSGFGAVTKVLLQYTQRLEKDWQSHDQQELFQERGSIDFFNELRQLLLAELDLRLQPVQGMLDAFNHEVN
tara:strand:- start:428 stop:1267 length:840 start_codon:yes stop_codon:yes gene_type:complete